MSYREQFGGSEAAASYDTVQYPSGSYSSLLWTIEREQLDTIIGRVAPEPDFGYLDFACGTGRILEHLAPRAGKAHGIEISPAMVERIGERNSDVTVWCKDITAPEDDVEGQYDVITAFRFVLNAEPELRRRALSALNTRLRGPQAVLILNNHGNVTSHKALLLPLHKIRMRGRRLPEGNYLSHRALVKDAMQAGLRIERVAGCGFLGGRLARVLPARVVRRIEESFARSRLSWLGSNQMYLARTS